MERTRVAEHLALALLAMSLLDPAFAAVQMKNREREARLGNRLSRAKSRHALQSHLVLEFESVPTAETLKQLAERGLPVVAYLPLTGVVVRAEGDPDLHGLGVTGFDALDPAEKLSSELGGAGRARANGADAFYIVEFHADVPVEDRIALVKEAGLSVQAHPDLLRGHLLVRGAVERVRGLAEWDEVAYIFPASGELVSGTPLAGCEGAATDAGKVGQLTQLVGEGWDGPGLGAANLTFTLQLASNKLSEEFALVELQRAMAQWTSAVKVNLRQGTVPDSSKNINILFGVGEHGDGDPFDGPGHVLAHTYYPAPPNPEPIAGDLHFDDDENWNGGGDVDLYSVALHELGHALGLGHSDLPDSVMYPYYRRATGLTADDIGAIRLLYAATDGPGEAPAEPPPLLLTVVDPASPATVTAATVSASGTVTGALGTPSIRWMTARGEAGEAIVSADRAGVSQWRAVVPLELGENTVTLRAEDAAHRSYFATLLVQRNGAPVVPAPPAPPVLPVIPTVPTPNPFTVEVSTPGAGSLVTRNPISASGTMAGGTGRPNVRWENDRGFAGTAVVTATAGGYRWDVDPLPLQLGANNFSIVATDAAGRVSRLSFRVTYNRPPDDGASGGNRSPQVTIQSPGTAFLMTPAASIALRGIAVDSISIAEVRWECSCGLRGVAQGTTAWSIANLRVPLGSHTITVTAKDAGGQEGAAKLTVFRY